MIPGVVASARVGSSAALFTENWIGTDGAAWNATRWPTQRGTEGTNATPTTIQTNRGQLAGGGVPGAFTNLSVTDFDLLVKVQSSVVTLVNQFIEIGWRIASNVAGGSPNGYAIQCKPNKVELYRISGYALVAASADDAALDTNTAVWFRINVVGTTHKVRWWLDGNAEPGTWQITATDATYATGPIMLRSYVSSAVFFDDMTVT